LDVVRTTIFFLFWMNNVSHDKVIPPNAWLAPSPCRRALNQLCCLKNGELYCYEAPTFQLRLWGEELFGNF
jgi:hypothetical protein